jgi:hypothetical protein
LACAWAENLGLVDACSCDLESSQRAEDRRLFRQLLRDPAHNDLPSGSQAHLEAVAIESSDLGCLYHPNWNFVYIVGVV